MTTIPFAFAFALLSSVGVAPVSATEPAPEQPIAWTNSAPVTATEVLREHRYLRPDEQRWRREEGHEGDAAWREWSQRVALRRIARSRPEAARLLEDPILRESMRREARGWWLARWEEQCYGRSLQMPSDDELEKSLAGEERSRPDRLRLSHIFLRAESSAEIAEAVVRLREWGIEVRDLEDFSRLAREHSDSLSAPKGGRLGWLRKGWLPTEAEDVLYEVPEGAVSPPLTLRGGVHLFFVEAKDRARKEISPAQIAKARGRSLTEQRTACRQKRLADSQLAVGIGPGQWPDVEVGDWQVSGAVLQALYRQKVESSSEVVMEWIVDETLYQLALASGELSQDERTRLADLEDNALLGAMVDSAMPDSMPEPTDAELRELYTERSSNYRTTRELRLEVLRAQPPEGTDPLAFLDCLESAANALGETTLTWADAGAGCPGTVHESWPLLPMLAVANRSSPMVLSQIKNLAEGEVSAPIQSGEDFFVMGMVESVAERPMTFEESRARLEREVLRARRREARTQIVIGLLSSANFRWTPGGEEWIAEQSKTSSAEESLPVGEEAGLDPIEP